MLLISDEADALSCLHSHVPLPTCRYWHLLIPSDQARPGQHSLGFKHGKEIIHIRDSKGNTWKSSEENVREVQREAMGTFLPSGAVHRLPTLSPSPESPGALWGAGVGEEGSGEMPSFWLGAGLDHSWLAAAGPSHLLV